MNQWKNEIQKEARKGPYILKNNSKDEKQENCLIGKLPERIFYLKTLWLRLKFSVRSTITFLLLKKIACLCRFVQNLTLDGLFIKWRISQERQLMAIHQIFVSHVKTLNWSHFPNLVWNLQTLNLTQYRLGWVGLE